MRPYAGCEREVSSRYFGAVVMQSPGTAVIALASMTCCQVSAGTSCATDSRLAVTASGSQTAANAPAAATLRTRFRPQWPQPTTAIIAPNFLALDCSVACSNTANGVV